MPFRSQLVKDELWVRSRENMLEFFKPELKRMCNESVNVSKYGIAMVDQFQKYGFLVKKKKWRGTCFVVAPEIVAQLKEEAGEKK